MPRQHPPMNGRLSSSAKRTDRPVIRPADRVLSLFRRSFREAGTAVPDAVGDSLSPAQRGAGVPRGRTRKAFWHHATVLWGKPRSPAESIVQRQSPLAQFRTQTQNTQRLRIRAPIRVDSRHLGTGQINRSIKERLNREPAQERSVAVSRLGLRSSAKASRMLLHRTSAVRIASAAAPSG
jgi:hypothetical protein